MMKKTKFLALVMSIVLLFSTALILAACNKHEHSFQEKFTSDNTYHWRECDGCDEIKDKGEHTFKDDVCTVCGLTIMSQGLMYRLNSDNESYTVIGAGAAKYHSAINIPAYAEGLRVTGIADEAFANCRLLESVIIPDTVTTIGDGVFDGCTMLKNVKLSENLKTIGASGFRDTAVVQINLPSRLTYLGANVFDGCTNLTTINIPDGIKSIESYAFNNCTSLTSINLPNGLAKLPQYVFAGCSSLTELSIPESVTEIEEGAFYNCSKSLKGISVDSNNKFYKSEKDCLLTFDGTKLILGCKESVIPATVTSIGAYSFSGCSELPSFYLPAGVVEIGESAFSYCSGLETIEVDYSNSVFSSASNCLLKDNGETLILGCKNSTIPNSVKTIAAHSFEGCTGLTSIKLGNLPSDHSDIWAELSKLHTIESYAFAESGITDLTIGDVAEIANNAFAGCLVQEANVPTKYIDLFVKDELMDLTINNGSSLPSGCFADCKTLISVTIDPFGVKTIGSDAFRGCENLSILEVGEGVEQINSYAFAGCESLTDVTLPSTAISLGAGVFAGDNSLMTLSMPRVNNHLGYYFGAESYTSNADVVPVSLSTITITEAYAIADYAFYDLDNLISITADKATSIGSYAFANCSGLDSFNVANSVTTIGSYAFKKCSGIGSFNISSNVTSIGKGAFNGCSNLTDITLPFVGSSRSSSSGTFGYVFASEYNTDSYYYDNVPSSLTDVTIDNSDIDYWNSVNSTSVPSNAFYNCSNIKNITLTGRITSMGSYAFQSCTSLESFDMSGSRITSVSENAFDGCSALTGVTIGNDSYVTAIGNNAFQNCSSLANIDIPSSVTSIGSYAFSGCSALTAVTLPSSVTQINEYTFKGCSSLTEMVVSSRVTSIDKGAFNGCSSLADITLPFVGNSRSASTSGKFGYIFAPDNVSYYYDYNDYVPSSLTDVTIDNSDYYDNGYSYSVNSTSVPSNAFYNCSNIKNITLTGRITSIGSNAFQNCTSLQSFDMSGSRITSVSDYAFYGCSALTGATIDNNGYVTAIGSYAFQNCSSLANIDIPSSVTSIGSNAFSGCSGLTEMVVPNSVMSIGKGAFYSCSSLTDITLPFAGNNRSASNSGRFGYVFAEENASYSDYYSYVPATLTNVTINNEDSWDSTSIANNAFYGLANITSVTLSGNITSIGSNAFSGCSGLTKVVVTNNVTSISKGAFNGCSSITDITLPFVGGSRNSTSAFGYIFAPDNTSYTYNDYVPATLKNVTIDKSYDGYSTSIANNAFYGLANITSVKLTGNITSIESGAFSGCTSLASVDMSGSSIASIGSNAFSGCTSLATVDMSGSSITSIGSYAFSDCTSLTTVTLSDSVTSIADYAFQNCAAMTSISLPNGITQIGSNVFSGCALLATINFDGTAEEWNNVTLAGDWYGELTGLVVACSDSNITIGA